MQHYQRCLGGELSMTRVSDMPTKDQMPPELHDRLAYAHLKSGAIEFSVTDWLHQTRRPAQGNTVAMYLHLGTYGHLADKFGVHWFFQGEAVPVTAE